MFRKLYKRYTFVIDNLVKILWLVLLIKWLVDDAHLIQ
jgi:hypothetical protein